MPSFLPISLTARDFESNRQALIDAIRAYAPTKWNSFQASEPGTILIEAIAADFDLLSFLLDLRGQESFITTLQYWESLLHHAELTGYTVRRASASSLEVKVEATSPVVSQVRIKRGTKIRSIDGIPFEVYRDTLIHPGYSTPLTVLLEYGSIVGTALDDDGILVNVEALVKLTRDSSKVVLVDRSGNPFASEVSFGQSVAAGHILKLGNQWLENSVAFGSAPDRTRGEFAIVSIDDAGSSIWLDRAWDLPDWSGKWSIDNRNVTLVQGETITEKREVGTDVKSLSLVCSYFPVISGDPRPPFLPSGFFRSLFSQPGDSGIVVLVNGIRWEEVGQLITATQDSLSFEVRFDELDRAVIKFGDGTHGALLPQNSIITLQYRIGGGSIGNVQQGRIDTSVPTAEGVVGGTIFLSNPYTIGTGGTDRESLAEAKKNLIQFVRTNDRGVNQEDYSALASTFVDYDAGRIRLAKAVRHSNAVPRENNIVWIYSWAQGPNGQLVAPSAPLKRRLLDFINARKMIGDEIVVVDGVSTPTLIHLRYKHDPKLSSDDAQLLVANAVNSVFVDQKPGDDLKLSKLYDSVSDIDGILEAYLSHPFEDIPASAEFELFQNTVVAARRTNLSSAAFSGSPTIVVDNPSLFAAGGVIAIVELNRRHTTAFIESVSGSVVRLRGATTNDNYTTSAIVLNSDYWALGWAYELPIDLYIEYTSSIGSVSILTQSIRKKVTDYFNYILSPGEVLYKTSVATVAGSVSNLSGCNVFFNAIGSSLDIISPSPAEKVVLRSITINGVTF